MKKGLRDSQGLGKHTYIIIVDERYYGNLRFIDPQLDEYGLFANPLALLVVIVQGQNAKKEEFFMVRTLQIILFGCFLDLVIQSMHMDSREHKAIKRQYGKVRSVAVNCHRPMHNLPEKWMMVVLYYFSRVLTVGPHNLYLSSRKRCQLVLFLFCCCCV